MYKISATCMHLSRLEFTGHGDMSTGNLKNGAGETLMNMFEYCGAADELVSEKQQGPGVHSHCSPTCAEDHHVYV